MLYILVVLLKSGFVLLQTILRQPYFIPLLCGYFRIRN